MDDSQKQPPRLSANRDISTDKVKKLKLLFDEVFSNDLEPEEQASARPAIRDRAGEKVPADTELDNQEASETGSKTTFSSRQVIHTNRFLPGNEIYQEALEYISEGNRTKAIKKLQELIKFNASYPGAYINLGLLQIEENRFDAARQTLLIAIDNSHYDAIAYNHLGIIARRQGDYDQALKHYRIAVAADPEYANAYLNLGILQDIYLDNLPQALLHFQRYRELRGSNDKKIDRWIADIQNRIKQQGQ
ncbi:MAG: tetratricopeptide repeat protein [Gammaproteobacteria bacterium]|nr:tetratricopeptide repeat protein [Gammaproteobacteria bacterium]